jgi:hypothetical protein
MTGHRTRRPMATLAALAAFLLTTPGTASADPLDDMYHRLGVDSIGADYLVLIDQSGSMAASFDSMKDNLKRFTAALGDRDRIALVPFGDAASAAPWMVAKSSQASAAVDNLPTPGPAKTDYFAALDWAVGYLARDTGGGKVATLVLLTDGDPASAGLPPCVLPPDDQWAALRGRAAQVAQQLPLNAYALPVDTPHKQCPDVSPLSVLQKVFPNAERLDPHSVGTATYLDQAKNGSRSLRARQILESDGELTKRVTVDWPTALGSVDPTATSSRLMVQLSTSGKAPARVDGLSVASTVTVTDPDEGAPRQATVTLTQNSVTVVQDKPATLALIITWPRSKGRSVTPRRVSATGTITLHGTVTSPYLTLAGGGLDQRLSATLGPVDDQVSGTGTRGVSITVWLIALVLGIVILVMWAARRGRARPTMKGMVVISGPGGETDDVSVQNRRRVRKRLAGGLGVIEVRGVRAGGDAVMSMTHTSEGGTIDNKLCPPERAVMMNGVDFRHSTRQLATVDPGSGR